MKKKRTLLKVGVMSVLVVGLSIACVPAVVAHSTEQAAEVVLEEAAEPAVFDKTEVVYATLTPEGATKGIYVVNQFEVSKAGEIVDFGPYSAVVNLTDQSAIDFAGEEAVLNAGEGAFYYQGNVEVDGAKLPWDVRFSYALDGVAISPEDLAGKSGALSVRVTTSPAAGVDRSFADSYMLQITFTLNGDTTTDIVAEGATLASAGRNRTVAFTVLPGRNADCTLSAQVTDFEMSGVQIAALPYSMAMEMPDASDLTGQMQELSDAVNSLAENGDSLAAASDQIDGALGLMAQNLTPENLSALESLPSQIGNLLPYSADELEDIAAELATQADGLKAQADQLMANADALEKALTEAVAASAASEGEGEGAGSGLGSGGSQIPSTPDEMRAAAAELYRTEGILRAQASYIAQQAAQVDAQTPVLVGQLDGLVDLAGGIAQLSDNYSQFNEGLKLYVGGVSQLNQATIDIPATMRDEIEAMMADYEFPEFNPISFIDSRNNAGMEAVQFVLTTEAIEVAKLETPEEVEEEEMTIIDRFFALFK